MLTLLLALCASTMALRHGHWTLMETMPPPNQVHVLLALKQQNVAEAAALVALVSDPESPKYTDYLTQKEVGDLLAPSAETHAAALEFVKKHASSNEYWTAHRDVVKATFDREIAEQLFNVELRLWEGDNGRIIVRSQKVYTMPEELKDHVDLIHGLSDFTLARSKKAMISSSMSETVAYERSVSPKELKVAASSNPVISLVAARGSPPAFLVKVEIRCISGHLPTSLHPICPGDQLDSIQVSADVIGGPSIQHTTHYGYTSFPGCALGKKVGNNPQTVFCEVELPTNYYYPAVNITVAVEYSSGKFLIGESKFMAVATPPVLPQTLKGQYGIPQHATVLTSTTTQAVAEFEQQYYSDKDLRQFFTAVGMDPKYADLVKTIGPNNQTHPGGEANLDIQYIMGVAPNATTTFWSIKAVSAIEIDDILKWAYAMGNATNPPSVTSISYGMSENQVNKYLGKNYLQRSDVEFMKLALMGLTIIIASGDTGAGDLGPPPMSNPNCTTLHPDWPSQSQYVTAIGSTYITPLAEPTCYGTVDCSRNPPGEVAVSMDNGLFWTSGGGFASSNPTAPYQKKAVHRYLNSGAPFPPNHVWNRNGRAYPDAVACGHNLMVVLAGRLIPVDGTSASAPIFAGIITLLNDQRARVGKKPLGFLNHMLYKVWEDQRAAFYDVTVGNNRCGAYPGGDFPAAQTCCAQAFEAAPGFDAVSGLGSPYYPELLKAVLAMK